MIVEKDPDVSVVMTTHEDAQNGILQANLKSLEMQKGVNIEVIVMDTTQSGVKKYPKGVKIVRMPRETRANTCIKIGMHEVASKTSKYFLPCNDDLIFSKYAIRELVMAMGEHRMCLNTFSNTDNHYFYFAEILLPPSYGNRDPIHLHKRFYQWEEAIPFVDNVIDWEPKLRLVNLYPTLCLHAPLMHRDVVMSVIWPEDYIIGFADTDLCMQMQKKNIPIGVCFSAFVFHLGGATTSKGSTDDVRKHDMDMFEKKWGVKVNRPDHLK